MITIRKTTTKDLETILDVEYAAFHRDGKIKRFVTDLMEDPTAAPTVSLLAYDGKKAVGHILFTRGRVKTGCGFCDLRYNTYVLTPMGVIPEYQDQGIGKQLIEEGLRILREMDVERCFVLGYKAYYTKHGFHLNAGKAGWPPPFPLADRLQDSWMWLDLVNEPDDSKGQIICSNTLMQKKYWKE